MVIQTVITYQEEVYTMLPLNDDSHGGGSGNNAAASTAKNDVGSSSSSRRRSGDDDCVQELNRLLASALRMSEKQKNSTQDNDAGGDNDNDEDTASWRLDTARRLSSILSVSIVPIFFIMNV